MNASKILKSASKMPYNPHKTTKNPQNIVRNPESIERFAIVQKNPHKCVEIALKILKKILKILKILKEPHKRRSGSIIVQNRLIQDLN